MDNSHQRKANYPIMGQLLERWSPRAFNGEVLSEEEIHTLLEAARWAPSSYNNQPWVFLYALKGSPAWDLFFAPLIDFNKGWVKNAGALVAVLSRKLFYHNDKPCRTHSFDTGAAWMSLALEARHQGLYAHGMEGFDYDLLRKNLEVPSDYEVEAMLAVGKPGDKSILPEEMQKREFPADRKALEDIAWSGSFSQKKTSKP